MNYYPASPNLTAPHHTSPCQAAPYIAAPRLASPHLTQPGHTSPYLALPRPENNCGIILALPDGTGPYPAVPNGTGPYHAAPSLAAPNLATPYTTLPRRTLPYLTAPNGTQPSLASAYPTLMISVQSFARKATVLRTPVTKANLSTSGIHPFVNTTDVDKRILDIERDNCAPDIENRAHPLDARHTHFDRSDKVKGFILPQFRSRARAVILKFCMAFTVAAGFCNHAFFTFLRTVNDHSVDYISRNDRAVFVHIQTTQKLNMCYFFIISVRFLSFGCNRFLQFRPFVERVGQLPVVHQQRGARRQFVSYLVPCHG